jgi:hypothetical protein
MYYISHKVKRKDFEYFHHKETSIFGETGIFNVTKTLHNIYA